MECGFAAVSGRVWRRHLTRRQPENPFSPGDLLRRTVHYDEVLAGFNRPFVSWHTLSWDAYIVKSGAEGAQVTEDWGILQRCDNQCGQRAGHEDQPDTRNGEETPPRQRAPEIVPEFSLGPPILCTLISVATNDTLAATICGANYRNPSQMESGQPQGRQHLCNVGVSSADRRRSILQKCSTHA